MKKLVFLYLLRQEAWRENMFWMMLKISSALDSEYHSESWQSLLLPVLKVQGEHRVYSTSASSFPSFQKHCNHLETASQKLEGVTTRGLGTTLHCKHTKCNWVLFSRTNDQEAVMDSLCCHDGTGTIWWVQEELCNPDTLNIWQVSASAYGITLKAFTNAIRWKLHIDSTLPLGTCALNEMKVGSWLRAFNHKAD